MKSSNVSRLRGPWGLGETIGAGQYFAAGALLTAIKLPLDFLLATRGFGREWSLMDYIFMGHAGGLWWSLGRDDQVFYVSMLALAFPFFIVGLALTVRRLHTVGWPLWLVAWFFAPVPMNIFFFLVLSIPSEPLPPVLVGDDLFDPTAEARVRPPRRSSFGEFLAAIFIPLSFAAAFVYLGTSIFREYGWSLFIGFPFILPMISVIIYGYRTPRTSMECFTLGWAWILSAFLLMLATAYEGIVCIIMAFPLILPLVFFGVAVGYFIIENLPNRDYGKFLMVLLAALPAMIGAEHAMPRKPEWFEVTTAVEVDAPPDRVWQHVIAFPDLPPPTELLFRAGIAYPIRARIEGQGVGAVRYCEFSTGPFVEPIEVWEPGRLLRFGVTSNPMPMQEWNPFFEIHPPHLDNFLVSRRGQFLLSELPGGRTRLEGTTSYRHGLWPGGYWRLWSDAILHRIHARVLEHVKKLAEEDSERGRPIAPPGQGLTAGRTASPRTAATRRDRERIHR